MRVFRGSVFERFNLERTPVFSWITSKRILYTATDSSTMSNANIMEMREEAKLSGLVFLDSNSQKPEWTKHKEIPFPSIFEKRLYGHTSLLLQHPRNLREKSIVFLGGMAGWPSFEAESKRASSVNLCNIENGEWYQGPEMIEERFGLVAVVCGGSVYALGRKANMRRTLDSIEWIPISDLLQSSSINNNEGISMKTWNALKSCLSTPRYHAGAVSVHDRYIVVAGGTNNDGHKLSSVDIIDTHDPSQSVAIAGPCLNRPQDFCQMATVGSRIFVLAGDTAGSMLEGFEQCTIDAVAYWDFDPSCLDPSHRTTPLRSWTVQADFSQHGIYQAAARVGSCLVVAGEIYESIFAMNCNSVVVFDTKRNKRWELSSTTTDMMNMNAQRRLVALSNGILCFGADRHTVVREHLGLVDKNSVLYERLLVLSGHEIRSVFRNI